jgi:hypothetical protein
MSAAEVLAVVTTGATAITVAVSVFSLQTARTAAQTARESDRRGRMPVLVCQTSTGPTVIQNLGSGPALNVAIARAGTELADLDALEVSFDQLERTTWAAGGHLQPIEPGTTVTYDWRGGRAIGLTYTDALGVPYTTLASTYGTKVFDGNAMEIPLRTLDYPDRIGDK